MIYSLTYSGFDGMESLWESSQLRFSKCRSETSQLLLSAGVLLCAALDLSQWRDVIEGGSEEQKFK